MPTYAYKCGKCQEEFDDFHSINFTGEIKCPQCQSLDTRKLITAGAGIIFKGSGFYETDYKRGTEYKNKEKSANSPAISKDDPKKQDTPKPVPAKPAVTKD